MQVFQRGRVEFILAWCRIELLGGLKVRINDRVITRFRTGKTASLQAYLAYHLDHRHHRDLLTEMLRGDSEPEQALNSLNKALSSLKHQLTLSESVFECPIHVDRFYVGLRAELVTTDVTGFEVFFKKTPKCPARKRREFFGLRRL